MAVTMISASNPEWGTVFLLDDDRATVESLSRHLHNAGFKTVAAHDSSSLEGLIERTPHDAFVIDINFGESSREGIEVAKRISATEKSTPIILYSAMAQSQEHLPHIENTMYLAKSALGDADISALIHQLITKAIDGRVLYRELDTELVSAVKSDVVFVDQQLMLHFANHPEELRRVEPRRFEEIIAEIWHALGYKVKLTPQTRDGGKDIYAVEHSSRGDLLYVIECKRYAAERPVSVDVIRALYGVTEAERATMGMVVTTSYFAGPALDFQQRYAPYRLSLRDFTAVSEWLQEYSKSKPRLG